MPEFMKLTPPSDALERVLNNLNAHPKVEKINTIDALDRVASQNLRASVSFPPYPKSTVDGYAVKASDTYGASASQPLYLSNIGEVKMGTSPQFVITQDCCSIIHTGGMLPEGADAVVMLEDTQETSLGEVEIFKSVAVGENVIQVGEDVMDGQLVLERGRRIRPVDIGMLIALGITEIEVNLPPRIGIISSGDELVSPNMSIGEGQVRDVNSYSLSALFQQMGSICKRYGIVSDDFKDLHRTSEYALMENDMIIITAGSSVSERDITAQVVNGLGEPGILVHGINVRPGKPTIFAICANKLVIGLPGNPVSALVIATIFVKPLISQLMGEKIIKPKSYVRAELSVNVASSAGREDWVAVKLLKSTTDPNLYVADPVFGKSNLIITHSFADGLFKIPAELTGLMAGEWVDVYYI